MTVIQKTIGRLPVNIGDYDSTRAYGKKNRVLLYGCEWESKVDNNTYAPAALNTTTGVITPDTTHWKLISGSYNTWLIDNGYQKMDATNVKDGNNNQHQINASFANEIGSDSTPESIKGRITNLEEAVGSGGSVDERIAEEGARHYLKSETYTKSEVNGMITTPDQEYVTVTATDQTTAVTDVLPATGEPDTVYRVGNWDGNQYDATAYSEYAWNESTSQYIHLSTKTQIGEVFDISAYHATGGTLATYSDLNDALNGVNGGVPQSLQKGGMSVKYVDSSDNKYVQYFLTKDEWSVSKADWEKVNLEEEVSQLSQKMGGTFVIPLNFAGESRLAVAMDGTITPSTNYWRSDKIFIRKGYTITYQITLGNLYIALIATTNAEETSYVSVLNNTTTEEQTVTWTAPNDCFVVIDENRWAPISSITISKDTLQQQVDSINEQVDSINEQVDSINEQVEENEENIHLLNKNLKVQTETGQTSTGTYAAYNTQNINIQDGDYYIIKTDAENSTIYIMWNDASFIQVEKNTIQKMEYPSGKTFGNIRVYIGNLDTPLSVSVEVDTFSEEWNNYVKFVSRSGEKRKIQALILGDSYSQNGGQWVRPMMSNFSQDSSWISLAVGSASLKDKYQDRETYPYTSRPISSDNTGNHNTLACQIEKLKRLMVGTDLDAGETPIYQTPDSYPNVIIIAGGKNDMYDYGIDNLDFYYYSQLNRVVSNVYKKMTSNSPTEIGNVTIKTPIDEVDRTCFAGAYRYLVEELLTLFPNANIYFATVSPISYRNGGNVAEISTIVSEQQRKCADILGATIIDWHKNGQINSVVNYAQGSGTQDDPYVWAQCTLPNRDTDDQLHINARGGKKYGKCAANVIKSTFIDID